MCISTLIAWSQLAVPQPSTEKSSASQQVFSRRALLSVSGGLAFSQVRKCHAYEGEIKFLQLDSSLIGRFVEQPDGWQRFESLDFQLDLPIAFQYKEPKKIAAPPGRGRAAPPSAIKATFVDLDGRSVTILEYAASQIKPTFFQLSDISQYGGVKDVAKLLIPPGSRILDMKSQIIQQPERETGTLIGKVKAAPQTLYRFEYQQGPELHAATAAVARAGKVLIAGATASGAQWDSQPGILRRIVDSFQLTFPN